MLVVITPRAGYRHSGSNGTENSLKESGKLLDCFGRTAEGA
jgi:hypothetical protein